MTTDWTSEYPSTYGERTYEPRTSIDFDHTDAKGRQIGCTIERGTQMLVAKEDNTREYPTYSKRQPGLYFTACVEATRDGVRYGACQTTQLFATAQERNDWIAKRIVASRKAAAKKGA